ncbi:hypothetical protein [Afipia sp. P52-10]|uniref:hypothetical protein n=1 Tax=Afipia sp. P52-10 TaxID=1429916 RepID=UPI001268D3A9|nr:hypothetical protein [Afipia sp. P52-10]
MTMDEFETRLASLGVTLPEADRKPLLDMVAEIERAAAQVREGLTLSDEMAMIYPTDRLVGGAA